MSTSQLFLQPDEIEGFLHDTVADDTLTVVGYEGRELGICPYVTFYVFHDKAGAPAVADAAIQIFEEFSQLIDEPWQLIYSNKDQDWHKPSDPILQFDMHAEARRAFKKVQGFYLSATDAESPAESARWAFDAVVDECGLMQYTRVKLTFRDEWYRQNRSRWHAFVERFVRLLIPGP